VKAVVHEGLRRTAALAAILFLTAGAPYASIVHAQDAQGYVESYVPADIAGSAAGSPYADDIASDIIEPPVTEIVAREASGELTILQPRWAMSHLRGPMTSKEIRRVR